jgi:putative ABC transport system ATP-binding protein
VAGLEVGQATPAERAAFRRRHLGFVFPSDNLSPVLSLCENVELALALRGARGGVRAQADRLLSRFGLDALADRFPTTLSSGEAQRGAIVRAAAGGPSLLLADEPTAHLDAEGAARLLDLFAEIREGGEVTLVVATHDERLARPADRVLRMEDGSLWEEGAP